MNVGTTPAQSPALVFYVFRSYGLKNITELRRDSCAAAQLRARDLFQTRLSGWANGKVNIRVFHEYRRKVDCLAKLPVLKTLLDATKPVGGRVYIDDFRRLFTRCDPSNRGRFLEELMEYRDAFWDIRNRRALSDIRDPQLRDIVVATGPVRPLVGRKPSSNQTQRERRNQTSAAAAASAIARKDAATKSAVALAKLKAGLVERGINPTLQAIANAANDARLTTARGTPWSASTVCRALKKLDDPPTSTVVDPG